MAISAGRIEGVGTFTAPKALYKTLSTIADSMNKIKKTQNEALRKTQAIQLAGFAYAVTLSEHVFMDANGRTCRLFADTILQTFELPPHTPLPDMTRAGHRCLSPKCTDRFPYIPSGAWQFSLF